MDILPLLLEIGFIRWENSEKTYKFVRSSDITNMELFNYCIDTNGVYSLILQRTNFVPIRVEVTEENEKLVYDFISNHFGKECIRDFKLKKIL
jgi:hypothetical protein